MRAAGGSPGPAARPSATGAAASPGGGEAGDDAARRVLPNGVTVVARENHGAPVVAFTLLGGAGSADERPELNGVTALLGRVLLKGTSRRTALEVARAAEDAGGGIESATDQEFAELRVWGLGRHWRVLLALLHEVATAPRLAEDEIERERDALLAQIRGLEDQPAQVANRVLARALFGLEGYGLPPSGTAATVTRLTRADLAARFREVYVAPRLVLGVSGAVPAEAVLEEAAELFGDVATGTSPSEPPPPPPRPVHARDGETCPTHQAHLLFGFFAPPVGAPDHLPLRVMNGVLGGGMSSRLFRTLRDEHGLAYSVGSVYPVRRRAGRLVIHLGTAPANVPAAEAGIRAAIDRLAAEPVPDDELARTATYLAGSFVLDRRTNARRSFQLAFYELMGVGADYAATYPARVRAVEAAEVLRVARRHLVDPAVVVVGPRDA
ncbi:MAG TPA: pitrilysin family protein [Methylomirabilota bacterium]|nr:pitrilysin family protein [Methylomirabilota bacterium]